MTLLECKVNHEYIVEDMDFEQATIVRLQALGLTNGTLIKVLNNKRAGSVIFYVRGTRLAIGRAIAKAILVKNIN